MQHKYIIILLAVLIIICLFTFTIIYFANKNDDETFQEAFYTSVQIQTSIGMSNAADRIHLRNWITTQSILSYLLNIFLVIYLSVALSKI